MIINIGDEYTISTERTENGPVCHITFSISEEDFQCFSEYSCLPMLSIFEGTSDE